jgi:hypothetical protein
MHVAIVADTHVPSRADELPDWVREAVRDADHVIHAGDFDSQEAYEEIADLAAELTAVRGNMDPEIEGAELPETTTVDLGGVRFVVTHGTGPIEDYRDRVVGIVRANVDSESDVPTVGVSGHTHQLVDETIGSGDRGETDRQTPYGAGIRLLNPGSATGADPAEFASIYVVRCEDGEIDVRTRREE